MILQRLRKALLFDSTAQARFWFALVTLGHAAFMTKVDSHWEFRIALLIFPAWLWSAMFAVSGTAMMVGMLTSHKYWWSFVLEHVLGVLCWLAIGTTISLSQGLPGATLMASLVSAWLAIRYPDRITK